jgi:hypothetical protein
LKVNFTVRTAGRNFFWLHKRTVPITMVPGHDVA